MLSSLSPSDDPTLPPLYGATEPLVPVTPREPLPPGHDTWMEWWNREKRWSDQQPNASNADSARTDINIAHGFIRELHGLPEFEGQVHTLAEMRKHLQAMLAHSATTRLNANLRAYGWYAVGQIELQLGESIDVVLKTFDRGAALVGNGEHMVVPAAAGLRYIEAVFNRSFQTAAEIRKRQTSQKHSFESQNFELNVSRYLPKRSPRLAAHCQRLKAGNHPTVSVSDHDEVKFLVDQLLQGENLAV